MLGSSSFSHYLLHHPLPQLAPNCGYRPTPAPPLSRGMWAGSIWLDWGDMEGGTQGGTQEVGGPTGASRKRATTFVVACFCPSLFPLPQLNSPLLPIPQDDVEGRTTTQLAQRRAERQREQRHNDVEGANDNTRGSMGPAMTKV